MTNEEYQKATATFRLSSYSPEACVMGLCSEVGEVAGVFQKFIRGDYGLDVTLTKLKSELGDVLFHISEVASDNGWSLADLMSENISKLEGRKFRNSILGSGDDR